jgi:uncharacterized tellurite resistance protein B-like protein
VTPLRALKRLFEQGLEELQDPDPARVRHGRELAVAALLVETIRADHKVEQVERDAVRRALVQEFALPEREVDELLATAGERVQEATSLYEFTSRINDAFEHEDKVRIVEQLWTAAYADGELEKHEAHLIRRIADLLHLRHREYIGAKLRAQSSRQP